MRDVLVALRRLLGAAAVAYRRAGKHIEGRVWAIIALAVVLATGWALCLPIFLAPDEDSHYDYALTLFEAGRPLRPSENILGRDTQPVVEYLMSATHARQQRIDPHVPADSGYGTPQYERELEARAPHVDRAAYRRGPIRPAPYIARLYPIGYYALVAGAISLGNAITHGSILGQFFFARFLSVALLIPALLFAWLSLRELPVPKRMSLAIFASAALLPMLASMAGSIQPDNLSFALISALTYVALRLRRSPGDVGLLAGTGVLFALLIATKHHFFAAAFLPIAAMLAVRLPFRSDPVRATIAVLLIIAPAAVAYAVTEPMLQGAPGGSGVCMRIAQATETAHRDRLHQLVHGLGTAFGGTFLLGQGLESFWFEYTAYRNTFITLGTNALTTLVAAFLPAATCMIAALFLVRLAVVWKRLFRLGRRRSWRSLARVATSNVLVNGYVCLFIVIFGYITDIGGTIGIQGRYWLPYAVAIFFCAFVIAPKALPRSLGDALRTVTIALVLGFDVLASIRTFPSMHERFYEPAAAAAPGDEIYLDAVAMMKGDNVNVRGIAFDLRRAQPVSNVFVVIDGRRRLRAQPVARPDVECETEKTLLWTGFALEVSARNLGPGRHSLALFVRTPWERSAIDTRKRLTIEVGNS